MSLKVSVPATSGVHGMSLSELEPGALYSVVSPRHCKGDIVMAVRGNSYSRSDITIVILTCRRPFSERTPFVGTPPTAGRWVFEPAPEGTVVTIKND